ncbi:MAG: HEAT repeat domain-containing protein [Gemmatimonadaceae bacterium]
MRRLALTVLIGSLSTAPATGAAQDLTNLSQLSKLSKLSKLDTLNIAKLDELAKLGKLDKLSQLENLHRLEFSIVGSVHDGSIRPLHDEDPADSLFRLATRALNRSDYRQAATLFRRVWDRYPKSERAPEALYFEAFALMRIGDRQELKAALTSLNRLQERYPNASQKGDANSLRVRVCGALAQRGDEECASEVTSIASSTTTTSTPSSTSPGTRTQSRCPDPDDEDDERVMALNALLTMDSERALPLLERIMDRRDACAYVLRRKATFLIAQKHSSRAADILIKAIREDPDEEVRKQAVFWLSQTRDPRVPGVLRDLIRSGSRELQKNAVFSLSQLGGVGSGALREIAGSSDTPDEIRGEAIFWLGQNNARESGEFLRHLFNRVRTHELKDKIIFALSQQRGTGSDQWLLDIAVDNNETVEIRKQALFWAGQNRSVGTDRLAALYDRATDSEIREQLIFVFSQRNERAAVDKLMNIARSDRDKEMRKKAIFWLGQSRDPRVLDFLAEMIGK